MSRYRIVLRGRLSERFESAFEGMALEPGPNQTVLVGDVRDQTHLYGLLDRLRDFGIELLAVEQADTNERLLGTIPSGMRRVARGFVSTDASAQECVQDAWLGVIKGLASFVDSRRF